MELATLGIAVDSRQVRAADSDLKKLSDTGARTERSLEGVGAAGRDAARGSDATARSSRDAAMAMDRQDSAAKRLTMSVRYFAAAALAAGAASVAWAASMTRHLDQTSKMAQQIGVTTEALTGMRFAAQQFANISDQQFDMSMRRMTRRIQEAAAGGGAAKGALDALGLSARELSRMSPDQQMLALADAMAKTESQAQRLQYTMALFDTEGMALVPALQQGSAALRDAAEMAQRFGVILSTDLAQAAEQFTTNMSLLNSVQQGYRQEIAERILPTIVSLTDRIIEFATQAGPASERVEKAFTAIGVAATATAAIIAGRLVGSITASAASWVAATAAAARHQMQLVQLSASIGAASAAMTGLSAAASGAMAVIARAAGGLSAVMGGPLGVITATGLASAAFLTMGRDARSAATDIDELAASIGTLSQRQLGLKQFELEEGIEQLEKRAVDSHAILTGLQNDVKELSRLQAEGYNITAREMDNAQRALLEEQEAYDKINAELDRKRDLYDQIVGRLREMTSALHGTTAGVNALNQAMGFSEAGEKYLAQLQGQIKALQDGGDPIKIATRWVEEHADATDADKTAIMSAAQALKTLQDAQTKAAQTTRGAAKALTEAQRAAQAFRREQDQSLRAQLQSVSAIHAQAQALEDQVALFGQSATAIEDLTIARLEEQVAMLRGFEGSQEQVEAIEREIEARKRLRTAIGSMEQKEAERAAWESWARDVEQIFQQVGQSLTDALFEGGKSARDLIKDLFKTLTLRVFIQPMMGQLQGWATNILGGLFGVQNPQQGGGMLGTAQNLYSGYNALNGGLNSTFGNAAQWLGQKIGSEALTSFGLGLSGTTAATGIASIGAGLGASLGTSIGTSAAAMTTTTFSAAMGGGALIPGLGVGVAGGGVGAGIGAAAAAGGAAAGGAAAGGAAGIGAAVGSALPWIGGALAIGSAFGLFGDDEPRTRHAQMSHADLQADGRFAVTTWDDRQSRESQNAAAAYATEAVRNATELFGKIGIDAEFKRFTTLMESSILGDKQGVGSSGTIRIGDLEHEIGLAIESSWTKHGFGGWSEAEMLPRLMTDVQLTILEAFQVAGDQLPSVLSGMLEGVDIRSLGAEQAQELAQQFSLVVEQVSSLQAALEQLPFTQLRDLSFDAAANLIQFAGGLENLNAGMTSYFQNFYSQEEQLAHQTEQLNRAFGELGLTLPDVASGADAAKAAYREIVESLDLTTEEGQRAYATLMTLSGGFHELVTGMDQLAQSTGNAATRFDSLISSFMGMASDALSAVQQRGQEQIAKLSESFARTDAVFNAYRSQVQAIENQWGTLITTVGRSIRDLRGQVEASARLQYDQARAVISTALLTGQMPQTADLGEAIRTAQQGVTGGRYASAFDQREAYLKLANELEALQGIAKPELDAAQASLEQLEKQYNKLRGIEDYSGKSLSQLEKQLGVALSAEAAARTQIEQIERQISMAQLQYQQLVGINQELSTLPAALNALAKAIESARAVQEAAGPSLGDRATRYLADNPDVLNAYLGGYGKGQTAEQFALEHYNKYGRAEGRSFDVGTPYVPHDMTANIHRGEIIIDPRSSDILRRYGIEVQGGGSRETEQLLREQLAETRQQNRYLYEMVKSGKRNERNTEDVANAIAHGDSDGVVVVM